MKTNENLSVNLKKADLLISDYTLAGSSEDKDILLSVAGNYIRQIQDPEVELMYDCVCQAPDASEKEIYLEILIDLLSAKKSSVS